MSKTRDRKATSERSLTKLLTTHSERNPSLTVDHLDILA